MRFNRCFTLEDTGEDFGEMNKNFIQKRSLLFTFAFVLFMLFSSLVSYKVNAVNVPTITGTRTYSYYGNSGTTDGINGGNPNGIIPFTIIGSPPSGYNFIELRGVGFEFPYNAGNPNQKYNRTTISFLFVQPAINQYYPKTFRKSFVPIMSARKTSDSQLVQTTCGFGSENNDSLVITCEWIHPEYTTFNYFYFSWSGDTNTAGIATIYSQASGLGNYNPISLSVGDIQVVSSSDPLLQGQSTIINQNQQIINQNQQMITGMEVNNQLQQNQNDFLEQGAANVQNASNQGGQNASQSQQDNEQATSNVIGVVGQVIQAFNTPASDCTIPFDIGNLDMGNLDFCSGKPPAIATLITTIGSIIVVYAIYKTARTIFRIWLAMSVFSQGGNKDG